MASQGTRLMVKRQGGRHALDFPAKNLLASVDILTAVAAKTTPLNCYMHSNTSDEPSGALPWF